MAVESDALVFFGATGDLAYQQVFPALLSLVRRGEFDRPIIGVAKSGWDLKQLVARAHDSVAEQGPVDEAAFAQLAALLRYVDGDYADPARLPSCARSWARPNARCITWLSHPACFRWSPRGLRSRAARTTPASWSKSPSAVIWHRRAT